MNGDSIRLTMAQAIIRFVKNQYSGRDGEGSSYRTRPLLASIKTILKDIGFQVPTHISVGSIRCHDDDISGKRFRDNIDC